MIDPAEPPSMRNPARIGLALAAASLIAMPVTGRAAQAPWTCDGSYRPLGTVNGPGIYRFDPTGPTSFRFVAETSNATFSVSDRAGSTCTITCLHTSVALANVRTCEAADTGELIITVAGGEAIAISENPAAQPAGVPVPGPLPNDPLLIDPGCADCEEARVRALELLPSDQRSIIVVRGEGTGDRYVVTVLIDGEEALPPISVEDVELLPDLEVALLPTTAPASVEIIARYHADASRCLVAVGDPEACGPAGPARAPRDDARWREAGLVFRVLPDGPELFIPYLGQLCAGHRVPDAPDARPC